MIHHHDHETAPRTGAAEPASAAEPGRTTRTIEEAAQQGISGAGGALPFLQLVQRSFGRHDVSHVQAHTDSVAAEGAREMGAEAFATGNHVAFQGSPDLHTVAHEAAHVVQQRAGVHLKGGVGENGDPHEQAADAVADRVVAGKSAEDLLDPYRGGGAPTVGVQRKISYTPSSSSSSSSSNSKPKREAYASHWEKIPKGDALKDAQRALDGARLELALGADDKHAEPALKAAWASVATNDDLDLDIDDDFDKVVAAIVRSYKAAAGAKARKQGSGKIIDNVRKAHGTLKPKGGGRAPKLIENDMGEFDSSTLPAERALRLQTQLATTLLHAQPDGREVQVSGRKDRSAVTVSSNMNASNHQLQQLRTGADLRAVSAEVAEQQGLEHMSRKEAMANRVLRHAMKVYARLGQLIKDDGVVIVPPDKPGSDGVHAEIRIQQARKGDSKDDHQPTGTKYPCAACACYFTAHGEDIGFEMGPMWLTEAGIHTQRGGAKIGKLTDKEAEAIAETIASQYQAAIDAGIRMGYGLTKSGKTTDKHNADSESELSETTFKELQPKIIATAKRRAARGWRFLNRGRASNDSKDSKDSKPQVRSLKRKQPEPPSKQSDDEDMSCIDPYDPNETGDSKQSTNGKTIVGQWKPKAPKKDEPPPTKRARYHRHDEEGSDGDVESGGE